MKATKSLRRMGCGAAAMLALSAGLARGQCVQQWTGDFGIPAGLTGAVIDSTTFDPDGAGPLPEQLVVAGNFGTGSGVVLNKIGRWDGVTWRPFAAGIGTNTAVAIYTLTKWDQDGPGPQPAQLIMGGHFGSNTWAGGNFVSRWDVATSTWMPLGTGMNNDVVDLTVWDPDGAGPILPQLIAGGDFTTAGGVTVNRIARWDGAAWQPLSSGANGQVSALTTLDPDGAGPLPPVLVAGGSFTIMGGVSCARIAKFDGVSWSPLGTGVNGRITEFDRWDSGGGEQMVAAGDFTLANGVAASRIARYDAATGMWAPFGTGFNNTVSQMTTWDPDGPGPGGPRLVAAGAFTTAGGNAIARIAAWDGAVWSALGTGVNGSWVYSVVTCDLDGAGPDYPQLIAGGDFTLAAGNIANGVAAWISSPTPVVVTSPAPVQGCPGGQRTMTVRAAAGGFPSYQWRKNGVALADGVSGSGSTLLGTTSITLTISNMSAADAGDYDVVVTNGCGNTTSRAAALTFCAANCDCSTTSPTLNVNDFTCFLNRFAAASTFANCDGSTTSPILNVIDFTCFLNTFAAGCP